MSTHEHQMNQSDGGHSGIPYLYCSVKGCDYEEYTKKEEVKA